MSIARRHVRLGIVFAAVHLVAFSISEVVARQSQGWMGIFVWPVWLIIDLPWSLLTYLVVFGTPLNSLLISIRAGQPVLDYVLYPPYFIHGIIGTLWWGFLPRIYAWCKWRWGAPRNDIRRPN